MRLSQGMGAGVRHRYDGSGAKSIPGVRDRDGGGSQNAHGFFLLDENGDLEILRFP